MLKWSEAELTEFFGVAVALEEDGHSHSFQLSRDGLRLLVTLFQFEGAVYVSMFRDGLPKPVLTVQRELCSHAHVTKGEGFRSCFEAGSARKFPVTDMGIPPVLARGVRVFVEPQFQVELIEPHYVNT